MLPIDIASPSRTGTIFSSPKWQSPVFKAGAAVLLLIILFWSTFFPNAPNAQSDQSSAESNQVFLDSSVSKYESNAPEIQATVTVPTLVHDPPQAQTSLPSVSPNVHATNSKEPKPIALVTGISGMIGSYVAKALVDTGRYQVHGLVRFRSKLSNLAGYVNSITLHYGDITDSTRMRSLLREVKPAFIYHMAAQAINGVSYDSPELTMHTNVMGTLNLLEAVKTELSLPVGTHSQDTKAKHVPPCRILIAGSSTEYGQTADEWNGPIPEDAPMKPVSPYGVSKVATEMLAFQYFRSFGIQSIVARFFIQVAAGGTEHLAMQEFARQIAMIERGLQPPVLKHGNLQTKRDMTDIAESAGVVVSLAEKGVPGEAYNIGSGETYKMQDLLDMMLKQSKVKIAAELDTSRLRVYDEKELVVDNQKLRKVTGWTPKPNIAHTIKQVLDYWRREVHDRYVAIGTDGDSSTIIGKQ